VIAAAACRAIAKAFQPDLTTYCVAISNGDLTEGIALLKKLLHGDPVTISCDGEINFEKLICELGIWAFENALKERAAECGRRSAAMRQLDHLIVFQEEIDRLTPETISTIATQIAKEFSEDQLLWEDIVWQAWSVNPRNRDSYSQLLDVLKTVNISMHSVFPDHLDLSPLLRIILSDDIDEFKEQWKHTKTIASAVPQWCKFDVPHELPLISVVAYYGAMKCLRFLLTTDELWAALEPSPLLFAIAGGFAEAVRALEINNVPMSRRVKFAIAGHREEIFEWLMQQAETDGDIDDVLLPSCVECCWFYGVRFCLNHGNSQGLNSSLSRALIHENPTLFRLLWPSKSNVRECGWFRPFLRSSTSRCHRKSHWSPS
jgi:hypothetical protein